MTTHRRESPEVGAMVRRMVRALVRRAAEGDTLALEELATLEDLVPVAVTVAGHRMHTSAGGYYSWSEVAAATGVTRQAAHQRHRQVPASLEARWLCERQPNAS